MKSKKKFTKSSSTPTEVAETKKDILEGKMNTPETEKEESYITDDEINAIIKDTMMVEESGATTERMRSATALVSGKFNLDDSYRVTKYDDKGKSVNLTLENKDFIINVQVKDGNRHGLTVYED